MPDAEEQAWRVRAPAGQRGWICVNRRKSEHRSKGKKRKVTPLIHQPQDASCQEDHEQPIQLAASTTRELTYPLRADIVPLSSQ